MKRCVLVALVACHAPPAMTPPTPPTSSVAVQPGDIVISHVTVVPMTGDRELPDHSVVIRGERIAAVAPAEQIAAPAGGQVQVIDGTGRWLMPGLADMRVRLGEQRELGLYVAAGVTTVRDLSGDGGHLEWRDQAARGELVGPTIVIADPAAADPGTWRCPALVASDRRAALGEPDALKRRVKWLGTVRPVAVRAWLANPGTPEAIAAAAEEHAGAVRALAALAADAPILMGTDTGRPFVIAGASAHEELERMIQAGLPRPRVLQIATAEAARFLGTPGELGVVAAGARADLLLLASDPNTAPLPDVPDGVMLRGRWHARADLDGLLAEIASASHAPRDRWRGVAPLPGEAEARATGAFDVLRGDDTIGEERFAIAADHSVTSQLVIDVPEHAETTFRIGAHAFAVAIRVDAARLVLDGVIDGHTLVVTGRDLMNKPVELRVAMPHGAFLGGPFAAGAAVLASKLDKLAVGGTRTLTSIGLDYAALPRLAMATSVHHVERVADAAGHHVYRIATTTDGETSTGELTLDEHGGVVGFTVGAPLSMTFIPHGT